MSNKVSLENGHESQESLDVIFRKIKASTARSSDKPYISFDIKERLRGVDRKQCRTFLFPQIEVLSTQITRKKGSIRFVDVLVANLLKAYRIDIYDPSGVELAQRNESAVSIQSMGMRKIPEDVVKDVLKWLAGNGYIKRIKPILHHQEELDADGNRTGLKWIQERSTLWVATGRLNDLMTGDLNLDQSKVCRNCGTEKALSEYSPQKDGFEATCKCCRAERKRSLRAMKKSA